MTLRSIHDDIVPEETASLEGARNEVIPIPFHIPAQYFAFFFPRKILEFLNE